MKVSILPITGPKLLFAIIGVALMYGVIKDYVLYPYPKFRNPQIQSAKYIWPQGCPQKVYAELDEISENCLDRRYFFGSGREYGFPHNIKGSPLYYRVDKDALDIQCSMFNQKCTVTNRVGDVFVSRN